MNSNGVSFHHPYAFVFGCLLITAGVLAHFPMFMHASHMGYRMVGMPMDATMLVGMAMIPFGVLLAWYGLMPRFDQLRHNNHGSVHFHLADTAPLNRQHWQLVLVLMVTVAVDVMKPATLGFVMPGMTEEYQIAASAVGTLALVALTGTAIGSIIWGVLADAMGRRAAILLSALMFIGTAICGAMPTFEWNLIMCFLMGLSAGGLLPIAFALMAEMVPAAQRGWLLVTLGGVGTSAGYLLASGSAALLEPLFSWRILWLLGLPTGLLVIFMNHYIPESPRFLVNAGLQRQARNVLEKYGVEVQVDDTPSTADALLQLPEISGFRNLMQRPYLHITLGLVGAGLAWGLVNFGFLLWLPTNLRDMGMSMEDSNSLLAQSGLLALPGILAVIFLYHYWSSIRTLVLFVAATAASLLMFTLAGYLGIQSHITLVVSTVCLLISASGVIAMLIPYAAEIYPVHLRGTGAGIVAAASKAGGILGAVCGVMGLFENLTLSALIIALPLMLFGLMLFYRGIDTRGQRLEDIHGILMDRTKG